MTYWLPSKIRKTDQEGSSFWHICKVIKKQKLQIANLQTGHSLLAQINQSGIFLLFIANDLANPIGFGRALLRANIHATTKE